MPEALAHSETAGHPSVDPYADIALLLVTLAQRRVPSKTFIARASCIGYTSTDTFLSA